MHRLSTLAIAAFVGAACAPRAPTAGVAEGDTCSIGAIAWLTGAWTSVEGDATTVERWTRAGDRLVGEAETTRGGERVFGERLEIACAGGVLVYTASPEGQATAAFQATSVGGAHAVFENPEHDFPTRIEYRRDGDRLTAEVSGEDGGVPRVERWTMVAETGR